MEQCLMKSTATNKTKKVRVIPGYHLTLGITVTMLSLIVLIPLASVMVSALKLRPAEFWSLITKPTVRHAFATSIGCSFIAALINSVFGVIIAWVLVRYEFPGKRILDGCIELPFALPTSVAGITLSKMYFRKRNPRDSACKTWHQSILHTSGTGHCTGVCRNSVCHPCRAAGTRKT